MSKRRRTNNQRKKQPAACDLADISENELLWASAKVDEARAQARELDEQMASACTKLKKWTALDAKIKEARDAHLRTVDKVTLLEQRKRTIEQCAQEIKEAKEKAAQAAAHLEEARAEEDEARCAVRELRLALEEEEEE